MLKYENDEHRPPSKVLPYWRGPYRVLSNVGTKYTVQNLVTNKKEDFHVTNMKPFILDPEMEPEEVARLEQAVDEIEKVISRTGSPRRVANMRFRVKWIGDDNVTIEDWKTLRRTRALHEYLETNGMAKLIPREFFD